MKTLYACMCVHAGSTSVLYLFSNISYALMEKTKCKLEKVCNKGFGVPKTSIQTPVDGLNTLLLLYQSNDDNVYLRT